MKTAKSAVYTGDIPVGLYISTYKENYMKSQANLLQKELNFLCGLSLSKGVIPVGTLLTDALRQGLEALLAEQHPNAFYEVRIGKSIQPRCQSTNGSTIIGVTSYEEFAQYLRTSLADELSIVRADPATKRIKNTPYFTSKGFSECLISHHLD